MLRPFGMSLFCALAISCGGAPSSPSPSADDCTGFSDWQTSRYVLPYAPGKTFLVDQANCSAPGNGHTGVTRFGYDFVMPIGTTFTAARAGTIIHVEQSHFDGEIAQSGFDNFIVVQHEDSTTALYGHLTHDGSAVREGEEVAIGAILGRSGNTGNTANKPHLHFSVQSCDPVVRGTQACPTVPVTFRNTDPNPTGLAAGRAYVAQPY